MAERDFSSLGNEAGAQAALDELCSIVVPETSEPRVVGAALLHAATHGSRANARRLSQQALKTIVPKDDPYKQIAELSAFLALLDGEGKIMPNLWCEAKPDGEVEVRWEFGPDNWKVTPEREIRSRGLPIQAADGKYDLEIYAFDARQYGTSPSDFPEANRLAVIRGVDSIGSWKGKPPIGGKWISGVLRDKDGAFLPSPSTPLVNGENLLSTLSPEMLREKGSNWSSSTAWYWTAADQSMLPKQSMYASRTREGTGLPF